MEATKEKVLGTRGIKNRIKAINEYKTIIFILVVISLLSIVNCFLIYQYALEIQTFSSQKKLAKDSSILPGEILKDINNIHIEDNEYISLSSSYLKNISNSICKLIDENETLHLEIINLQNDY